MSHSKETKDYFMNSLPHISVPHPPRCLPKRQSYQFLIKFLEMIYAYMKDFISPTPCHCPPPFSPLSLLLFLLYKIIAYFTHLIAS